MPFLLTELLISCEIGDDNGRVEAMLSGATLNVVHVDIIYSGCTMPKLFVCLGSVAVLGVVGTDIMLCKIYILWPICNLKRY